VAREVAALEGAEVGRDEALVIAPDRPGHPRPWVVETQPPFTRTGDRPTLAVEQRRQDAGQRQGRGAGLRGRGRGDRRDAVATGLGLPPGVDDRTALLTDHPVVPGPGRGIDRLADGPEHPQAR